MRRKPPSAQLLDPGVEAARKATAAQKQLAKDQSQAQLDAQNKAMKERIRQTKLTGGHSQTEIGVTAIAFAAKLKTSSPTGGGFASKLKAKQAEIEKSYGK